MNAKRLVPVLGAAALFLSACNMPRVQVPPWVETEAAGDEAPEIAESPDEAEPGEPGPSEAAGEPAPEEVPPPDSGAGEPGPSEAAGEPTPEEVPPPDSGAGEPPESSQGEAPPDIPIPSGPDYTVYDDTAAMLARINAARTAQGLAPLSANSQLGNAALQHTIDMAVNDFMSHTGSNGSQPWDRVSAQGYSWGYVAENIAAGDASVDGTFNQWWNSSGHQANMLSPEVTQMGLGHVSRSGTAYGHYWTLVLARP